MPTSNTFLEPLPRLRGKDQVRIQPLGTVRPSAGFHSPPGAAVRRPPSGGARAGMLRGAARSTSRVHVYHAGIRARCVRRATACMRTRGCALRDGVNRHLALARGMRGRCTRGWGRLRRGRWRDRRLGRGRCTACHDSGRTTGDASRACGCMYIVIPGHLACGGGGTCTRCVGGQCRCAPSRPGKRQSRLPAPPHSLAPPGTLTACLPYVPRVHQAHPCQEHAHSPASSAPPKPAAAFTKPKPPCEGRIVMAGAPPLIKCGRAGAHVIRHFPPRTQ